MRSTTIASRFLVGGRWRKTMLILLGVLATLAAYEKVAVEFMHERRQDALVSQFNNAPTSSELGFGDALAVLQIPQISVNTVVSEGESHATLRAGPAHRSWTVMPGARGNAVIAGKSFRYGEPFGRLKDLAVGSEIFVKLRASGPVRYVVDSVETLSRNEAATSFASTDEATLTLVTSTSRFGGDALVVRATADAGTLVVDAPPGSVAPVSRNSVSFTDVAVVMIWLSVCIALAWMLARFPMRLRGVVRLVIFAPVVVLAALQFALAFERLLPATV